MMSSFKNLLFFASTFVLLHSGQSLKGWEYCGGCDKNTDEFGVTNFIVKPQSMTSVKFKLVGTPTRKIVKGGGEFVPTVKLKIYETKTNKEVFSDIKNLCDYTDCNLKQGEEAVIKVPIADIGATLKYDVYYTGKMSVIEKCGEALTTVCSEFCCASAGNGAATSKQQQ